MPYRSVADLPSSVGENLPIHAQEIFLAAFNHAFAQYADREDREEIAFRVAWAAVKRKYRKLGGAWVER
jgi:cation transport regulator